MGEGVFLDRSERRLVHDVGQMRHLTLMNFIPDDSYGRQGKANVAVWRDHAFATDIHQTEARREDGWVRLVFDSAVNSLPEAYYREAAGIATVALAVDLQASEWRVMVLRRFDNRAPQLVEMCEGQGAVDLSIPVRLGRQSAGRLCVELQYRGQLELKWLAWTAPAPKQLPKLGVSITTFNKQAFLLPNLEILRASAPFRAGLLDVLVVNNGSAIDGLPSDLAVITLDNVGGTGGFKAGYTHFVAKGYAKFVIMDDDIAIQDDFIERIFALSCLVGALHVGALAEVLNTPERFIKEQGGFVSIRNTFGLDLPNALLDLSGNGRHRLYAYRPVHFSGWWSLLVHIDQPQPDLPDWLFIKRDDILFGYQSYLRNVPTCVFPNLHVAHSEEGAPAYFYYDIRNDLVMRARSQHLGISIKQLFRIVGAQFLALRLDRQRMFNLALADFLKGPQAMACIPVGRKLMQVRKLADKPVPVPTHAPEITEASTVRYRKGLLSWLSPAAYRSSGAVSLIRRDPARHAAGRAAYYEPLMFTDRVYLRRRSPAAILSVVRGLWLVGRLALTRGRICRAYRSEVSK
jgi:hypothetical protein